MTETPEFPRLVDIRQAHGRQLQLAANEAERAALALRFGLLRIDRLEARLSLRRDGDIVHASGRLSAAWVQSCAVSAEDLPVSIDQDIAFRFVPQGAGHGGGEEIVIDADACDEIDYAGLSIDIGEAVAQSLALAIDPYATGPAAEQARTALVSERDSNPFAGLKDKFG